LYDAEHSGEGSWLSLFGKKKQSAWFQMGGKETLKSYGVRRAKDFPADHIKWMRALPYYAELEKFVLVHAGLNFKNEDPFEDKLSMLWLREYEIKSEKIGFRRIIHGHVPVDLEMITLAVNNKIYKFIDLDNGIYMTGRKGYGNLIALELNSMEFVIQDNLDM
jgi:serine/threonine protein phosphatase 1